MMLDWLYRLIHFRQRRMVVLRLRSSFISTGGVRLMKHEADGDARSSLLAVRVNRK
jgi:hypothetical protein